MILFFLVIQFLGALEPLPKLNTRMWVTEVVSAQMLFHVRFLMKQQPAITPGALDQRLMMSRLMLDHVGRVLGGMRVFIAIDEW